MGKEGRERIKDQFNDLFGGSASDISEEAMGLSREQVEDFKNRTEEAQKQVAAQRQAYENIEITNPYTNVFEDMTVNLQQAEFQAQQGMQQRANIMQSLRGTAGASGIAGLAQSLANQGQLQTQQISASIGQQESQQQQLKAQGELRVQMGDAMVQEAQTARQASLLGMDYGALAGAQAGEQQSILNQQSAYGMEMDRIQANQQMFVNAITGLIGNVVPG